MLGLLDDRCELRIAPREELDFIGKAIEPHRAVAHGLGLPPGDHLVELRQVLVRVCHR